MQTKSRKLNKEELELWKLVTKNDKILGKYTKPVEKNKIIQKKNILPEKKEKNEIFDFINFFIKTSSKVFIFFEILKQTQIFAKNT
jgi:hypothetical protein